MNRKSPIPFNIYVKYDEVLPIHKKVDKKKSKTHAYSSRRSGSKKYAKAERRRRSKPR